MTALKVWRYDSYFAKQTVLETQLTAGASYGHSVFFLHLLEQEEDLPPSIGSLEMIKSLVDLLRL